MLFIWVFFVSALCYHAAVFAHGYHGIDFLWVLGGITKNET